MSGGYGSTATIIKDDHDNKKSLRSQYIAGISASLFGLCVGLQAGWTAPTLPKLLSNETDEFHLDEKYTAQFINIYLYGTILGDVFGLFLPNYLGRKTTLISASIPFAISGVLLFFANSTELFFIARFISGISSGLVYSTLPCYLSEISTPTIRGHLNSFFPFQYNAGVLLQFIIVPLISIKFNALLMIIFPIISIVIFVSRPETPYFFVLKNSDVNAVRSLRALNRIDEELIAIKAYKEENSNWKMKDFISSKGNRKALGIAIWINLMEQLSGFAPMATYTIIIFQYANSIISSNLSGVIYAVSSTTATLTLGHLLDKFGRRPILLSSCLLTSIILFFLGLYFKLEIKSDQTLLNLIPLVLVISFSFVESFGLSTMPQVAPGELFQTNLRPVASAIMSILNSLFATIAVDIFDVLKSWYGFYAAFWFFSFVLILSGLVAWVILPETKGKTLEEIQIQFSKAS